MFINIQGTRIRIEDIVWYGKRTDDNAIIIGLQDKSVEFSINLSEAELERTLTELDEVFSTKSV